MTSRSDFYYTADEPHAIRRKQILEKHPEITELFGPDPRPIPYVLAIIASQLLLAYFQKSWSWPVFLIVAWSYGGMASHALSLMTHELSHNLVFANAKHNDYFGIVCNLGMGIPSSTMFKRYHMEHHQFQGCRQKDTDLPCAWEGRFVCNAVLKAVWLFMMPFSYAIRPMVTRPKTMRPLDLINVLVVLVGDVLVAWLCGPRAVLYLALSTLLGMGLHPCAGHFIAEHTVFAPGQETYSYYGPLNLVCWNVGYHNEHHDMPRVPGWRLPQVRATAPEFYDDRSGLVSHNSWTGVMWTYITDPSIGPFCRQLREQEISKLGGSGGSIKTE